MARFADCMNVIENQLQTIQIGKIEAFPPARMLECSRMKLLRGKGDLAHMGGYDREEKAARAYDLAALKYWGPTATTNFPKKSSFNLQRCHEASPAGQMASQDRPSSRQTKIST